LQKTYEVLKDLMGKMGFLAYLQQVAAYGILRRPGMLRFKPAKHGRKKGGREAVI
jgi:hypothetical protein